jgi:DNA mismatch repair ATPase MutS
VKLALPAFSGPTEITWVEGITISSGGVIRSGFSAELDGILIASRDAKTWVANLEKTERERTGNQHASPPP